MPTINQLTRIGRKAVFFSYEEPCVAGLSAEARSVYACDDSYAKKAEFCSA